MIEINEKALEDLGRRLAAAYISYLVAHKGVDRVLKEMPEEICGFLEADGESAVHSTCLDEARETG